jgi:hypothetical protein
MEELFAHPDVSEHFEPPVFTPGVSSRSLRSRVDFLKAANQAGLLPKAEWEAMQAARESPFYQKDINTGKLFDCLCDVPVEQGRKGSEVDVKLHYSVELWRKAKTVNRGRAVLGCTLAHLIAMKKCVSEDFDIILEDNVRAPPAECALRIREAALSSQEQATTYGIDCHMRYFGWLGSRPNLQWIFESYRKPEAYQRLSTDTDHSEYTTFPLPTTKDIVQSLKLAEEAKADDREALDDPGSADSTELRKPGGTAPVWGAYAYWVSKEAYEGLMEVLRIDVGALMWKSKRARYYTVKPIDKVIPRQIMSRFGQTSIQIATHPTFFRAPMLTSKIHSQWDPEFCKSTEYQLKQVGLEWSDLWLTETERSVVLHHQLHGEWLTPAQLEEWRMKGAGASAVQAGLETQS